ncbi:MAG: type II toxin-antitoxin system Phd/YefM family antitoxin [Candidatus Wildermuthbacteria bacterium]|nr:type II toxin-antitoxin system Phd/YefM family antitoxin [Candidatus Wildermuthbacteria bacterium]
MDTKRTLSISEARKRIFEIADEVQKTGTYYTLTEKGKPKVVVLSAEEFESLIETLEVLEDPETMERLREAEKAFEKGDYYDWEDLKKELSFAEPSSLLVHDESKMKYRVSSKKKRKYGKV